MLDFILTNLPIIICLLVGIGLLVVEVFLPGFGLPGITGIILEIVTVYLTWKSHGPVAALGMTIIVLAVIAITISIALKSAAKGRLSKSSIILSHEESPEEGYTATADLDVFLGKEGIATTVLRPAGIAEFDGVRLNVVSDGEFVAANTRVRIERVEGARILVRPL
jgi:membrane-bound ClpP family serine protease